jgi:hypothetical protein
MTAHRHSVPETEYRMTIETTRAGVVSPFPSGSAATAAARQRIRPGWFGAFAFDRGRVILRKTGNSAPLDITLADEVARWLLFQIVLQVLAALRRAIRPAGPAIWFTPDRPGPWYMVRAAAAWAGGIPRSGRCQLLLRGCDNQPPAASPAPTQLQFRLYRHFQEPRRRCFRRGVRLSTRARPAGGDGPRCGERRS